VGSSIRYSSNPDSGFAGAGGSSRIAGSGPGYWGTVEVEDGSQAVLGDVRERRDELAIPLELIHRGRYEPSTACLS
jgi:hypothetical protein